MSQVLLFITIFHIVMTSHPWDAYESWQVYTHNLTYSKIQILYFSRRKINAKALYVVLYNNKYHIEIQYQTSTIEMADECFFNKVLKLKIHFQLERVHSENANLKRKETKQPAKFPTTYAPKQ